MSRFRPLQPQGSVLTIDPDAQGKGPNTFPSWNDMNVVLDRMRQQEVGGVTLLFNDRGGDPIEIPGRTEPYDLSNVLAWVGERRPGGQTTSEVDVLEGARFVGGPSEFRSIRVNNRATSTSPIVVEADSTIVVAEEADISTVSPGAVPFFDGTQIGPGKFYQFELRSGGCLGFITGVMASVGSLGAIGVKLVDGILQKHALKGPADSQIFLTVSNGGGLYGPQQNFLGLINTQFQIFGPRYAVTPRPGLAPLTAPATIFARSGVVRADASGGAFQLTLQPKPDASFNEQGRIVWVKEISGSAGLTVAPSGGNTLDGSSGAVAVPAGGALGIADVGGTEWLILSEKV